MVSENEGQSVVSFGSKFKYYYAQREFKEVVLPFGGFARLSKNTLKYICHQEKQYVDYYKFEQETTLEVFDPRSLNEDSTEDIRTGKIVKITLMPGDEMSIGEGAIKTIT